MTDLDTDRARQLIAETILAPDFRRATFGGAARGSVPSFWLRVVIRPVEIGGQRHLQFSYFDATKDVTKNYLDAQVPERIDELLAIGYSGVHLSTAAEEIDLRTSRKGKIHVGRRKADAAAVPPPQSHNRVKDVPLPEGRADRVLEAMGILTRDGLVRPIMRPKFTQINELLRQLTHVLDQAGLRSLGRKVEILDCGCGSSYLTLAAHHYLNDVLAIPAHVIGVDVNDEVIRKSVARSERYGANGPAFSCGRIDAVQTRPDIVLALHACDTATDDAIAAAVAAEARVLLSVPCCHHHLNDRIAAEGSAQVLRPILRHGILRERTADLVTDAFRALILRILGYRTDVIEFISPEHTARNLMIRAVRGAPAGEQALIAEYGEMCRFWGVTPYLQGVLPESLRRILTGERA